MSEKKIYDTTEISKRLRKELKAKYKDLKFSVRTELYAGGSSIHLNVMESKKTRFIKNFDEINKLEIERLALARGDSVSQTAKEVSDGQKDLHHSLNQFRLKDEFKGDCYCNGVYLTEKGFNILKDVYGMTNKYNWDNSDSMTDYFDVNFYLHIGLGKWDKHFIDGVEC